MSTHYGQRYTSVDNPVSSIAELKSKYPLAQDGNYWINFPSIGPQFVYCILNTSINGGGWIGLNSAISPQSSNANGTTATWEINSQRRLMASNTNIINANIVETGCGASSFYELRNPSVLGFNYTATMLLMHRIGTIGQCADIPNAAGRGWYEGPQYQGTYTSYGMCNWGDGVFANACCNAQNMTGLKLYWVMLGSGTNPNLRYKVECAGGSGQHYHMWFIKQ